MHFGTISLYQESRRVSPMDIVCYLSFGAWNFLASRIPVYLDIHLNLINIHMEFSTSRPGLLSTDLLLLFGSA
jgi:hypothetical protein